MATQWLPRGSKIEDDTVYAEDYFDVITDPAIYIILTYY